jgi:hypothetical protein
VVSNLFTIEPESQAKRREGDYYPTPAELAERIVGLVRGPMEFTPRTILEPSAGSGSFVRACRKAWPEAAITAVEPTERLVENLVEQPGDTVKWCTLEAFSTRARFDLIIGNPPYSLAEEHVRICLGLLAPRGRLTFLLRLAFLESAKRKELFDAHPPESVTVLARRPSFTANGKTDSAAYAVFTWREGFTGRPELGWM